MDQFIEEIIARKNNAMGSVISAAFSVFMVLFGLMAVMALSQLFSGDITLPSIITTLVYVGLTAACYFLKDKLRVEYEYTYTAGELDFDKDIASKKRSHVVSFSVRDIHRVAPVTDATYYNASRTPDVKKIDLVLNRGSVQHYVMFNKNGRKHLMVFEPSKDFLQMLRSGMGRDKDKITIDENTASRPRHQSSYRGQDEID